MTIQTNIKEVQIYRRGSTVLRSGSVHLEAGETRVVIAGLTSGAYTDTMRLSFAPGVSASAVHILDPDHKNGESAAISEQIADAEAQIEALKQQAEMWMNIGSPSQLQNVTMEQLEKAVNAFPERVRAIHSEIRRLEKEKKELGEQFSKAYDRENRPLISAVLKVKQSGEYPFELRYQESTAGWDSRYEIHTDGKGPVTLKVKAEVRQNTGEDWQGIRLALRTGVPVQAASLPDLRPVYLDIRKPMPKAAFGRANGPVLMAMAEPDIAEEEMMMEDTATLVPLAMTEAEVSTSDTMTEYILDSVYDVRSGEEGLYADLQTFDLEAEYVIRAVPKKDIHAYLLAEIKTADLPMSIRGTAAVYLQSAYTGTAELSPDFSEETFAIALGAQERISLSRTEKKKKSSESLLKNQQTSVYEFDIQAVNGKDEKITLTILDQIPLSRDQTITVSRKELSDAEYDEKTGGLKWQAELNSHEMKTLHVEYSVSWPKDKAISGI